MGYRSDVAYTIVFRNKATLNEFIALVMLKGDKHAKALAECEIIAEDEGNPEYRVNFYMSDVKWYEGYYPEVDGHMENLEFISERFSENAAYHFVRVGEELEDNVNSTDGAEDLLEWDLCIERSISAPFDIEYLAVGDSLAVIA